MARFTTLYSGSSGNAGVFEENGRYLLVDVGLSCRATLSALASLGLSPEGLAGILITHEHSDHIGGLKVFLKRYPRPVYAGHATIGALYEMQAVHPETEVIAVDHREEEICGFKVLGFPTSHDSAGCHGFHIVSPHGAAASIATDLGMISPENFHYFRRSALVALEANYDSFMLKTGPYPTYLKRRIASERGHLSNTEAALAAVSLVEHGCRRLAFCHLSQENNKPELVEKTLRDTFFKNGVAMPPDCLLQIQRRHEPSDWIHY